MRFTTTNQGKLKMKIENRDPPAGAPAPIHRSGSLAVTPSPIHRDSRAGGEVKPGNSVPVRNGGQD
jgi:hypothetical protein